MVSYYWYGVYIYLGKERFGVNCVYGSMHGCYQNGVYNLRETEYGIGGSTPKFKGPS